MQRAVFRLAEHVAVAPRGVTHRAFFDDRVERVTARWQATSDEERRGFGQSHGPDVREAAPLRVPVIRDGIPHSCP